MTDAKQSRNKHSRKARYTTRNDEGAVTENREKEQQPILAVNRLGAVRGPRVENSGETRNREEEKEETSSG